MFWLEELRTLFDLGGLVLQLIALLALLMWACIFERLLYLLRARRRVAEHLYAQWLARSERSSWRAKQIRGYWLSRAQQGLERNLALIVACVALAPLLGLLGTVTGMIEVFEAMAKAGFGNPRAMAAGISRATLPTLAGMLVAISGLAASVWLQRQAQHHRERLAQQLSLELH